MTNCEDGGEVDVYLCTYEDYIDLLYESFEPGEFVPVSFTFDATGESNEEALYFQLMAPISPECDLYIRNVKLVVEYPAIDAPVALDYTDFTGTSFTANWEEVEDAVSYNLYVAEFDPYENSLVEPYFIDGVSVEGTSYLVEDIVPGTVYEYFVTATNADGDVSAASNIVEVAELLPVENITGKIRADYSGVDVTWDAVPGANVYFVNGILNHKAAADETFVIADADFSDVDSYGTVELPEESEYMSEEFEQLPGWTFTLPSYIEGGVGVEDNYIFSLFGYDASIQSGFYDFTGVKDGKVNVKLSAASGLGNGFAMAMLCYDEIEQGYGVADSFLSEEPLTTEFTDYEFSLEGATGSTVFLIMTDTEPIDYEDGNLFIRSLNITCEIEAGNVIGVPAGSDIFFENEGSFDVEMQEGDTFAVQVQPYTLDDEFYILIQGEPSEYVVISEVDDSVDMMDAENAPVRFFNLQGLEVSETVKGEVYIRVQGKKAQKVIRK